jgi:diadenosine tetraphosphate (Ap4A) HIT family hydrolase
MNQIKQKMKLNDTLKNDTDLIVENADYWLLLNKSTVCPWLIFVPKTDKTELFEVDNYLAISEKVNQIAAKLFELRFELTDYQADKFKINLASLGNVVSQLHIHIILRHFDDKYFPQALFGQPAENDKSKRDKYLQVLRQIFG